MAYDAIHPGELWLDTSGRPIYAHGFSVIWDEKTGYYYWYGENKEKSKGGLFNKVWTYGFRYYRSKDLCNWEDMGLFIEPSTDIKNPLHPSYQQDRPHILYCEKTGKYVCWIKVMSGIVSQFMVVLQSDNMFGPYEFVHKALKPLQMDTGDFTLVKDGAKAYFIFERPHYEMVCADLTDDYTNVTGNYSEHYVGLKPPYQRESPAYFKYEGKHYLLTSGTSGYYPNPTWACSFTDFHGDWEDLGEVCEGDDTRTSFNSQYCWVMQEHTTGRFIACGDRWRPEKYIPRLSAQIISTMEKRFKDYQADLSPKTEVRWLDKPKHYSENTKVSRFVWLPIEMENGKPVIRWKDSWNTEELK